jgi:hypothetical protein
MSLNSYFARCRRLGLGLILLLAATSARAGIDQWTNVGPFGGNVQALAVDPQNPATLYAAAPGGGVFKSTDGGANWASASNGIPSRSVTALAIDPTVPSTLYAAAFGTGTIDALVPSGALFKSVDGGQSWVQLPIDPVTFAPAPNATPPNAIAIDPQTPSTLFVATSGGIFKSLDGGQTWTGGSGGGTGLPLNANFSSVVFDPANPTILYAGSTGGQVEAAGLFKSIDGGNSWTAINSGIMAVSFIDVAGLAIDPLASSTLYASVSVGGSGTGLYKSGNGGGNWTQVQAGIDGPVAIDPQNPSIVYLGGGLIGTGVLMSSNAGASFTAIDTGLGTLAVNVIAINPQNPATLYAGTANGVFASLNAGAAWNPANTGLSLMTISTLALDPTAATTIYAGTGKPGRSGNGIFKSIDGGNSWTAISTGLVVFSGLPPQTITAIALNPATPTTLYAGDDIGDVFVSSNGGGSWTNSTNGINGGGAVASLLVDPQAPSIVYAALNSGVFKSADGGSSWALVANGLPNGISVSGLSLSSPPSSVLLLSSFANGLFSSTDGGGSWQVFDTTLPSSNAVRPDFTSAQQACADEAFSSHMFGPIDTHFLPITPTDAEVFVACVSPDATPIGPNRVRLANGYTYNVPLNAFDNPPSSNVGPAKRAAGVQLAAGVTMTSWAEPDGAAEGACEPLGPIVADPVTFGTFYTGGGCGVLQGTSSGTQMVSMNLGLPLNTQVSALAITPNASDLYAGTLGGVYRFSFAPSVLAAAVLPSSRSVELGVTATAFATIANGGSAAATSCGLAPATSLPADFFYQTTAPATNAVTGSPNTPVDIPAGAFQTFVFGFTPGAAFDPIDAQLEFSCSGQPPVAVLPGINTLLLSGSTTPVPDVVALVGTGSNDGILHIMGTAGANAFALATINIGAASAITATAIISDPSLPLAVSICQTNSSTGQCLAPPTPGVSQTINTDDTPTFAIFASSSGIVPFVPANNRIAVQFTDTNGTVRGSTSVAVETQ